jgi:hypothetical protein
MWAASHGYAYTIAGLVGIAVSILGNEWSQQFGGARIVREKKSFNEGVWRSANGDKK